MENIKKKTFKIVLATSILTIGTMIGLSQIDTNSIGSEIQAVNIVEPKLISMPTTIKLKHNSEQEVRAYYQSLNNLPANELRGSNLLKNLKPILKNGMEYVSYSNALKPAGIIDRDWSRSPIDTLPGTYDSQNNQVTDYRPYETSGGDDPILRVLYRNDNGQHNIRLSSSHRPAAGVGGTQKEHLWCQSRGFKAPDGAEGPAGTDLHHLITADADVNQFAHNNYPYGEITGTVGREYDNTDAYIIGNRRGENKKYSDTVFEPYIDHRGDVARACFYMVARYNNFSGTDTITQYESNLTISNQKYTVETEISTADKAVNLSYLEFLYKWHLDDPVDDFEIYRNDLIYNNIQHNRNPFIDYPSWISLIWNKDGILTNGSSYAKPATDEVRQYGVQPGQGGGDSGGDINPPSNVPVTGISVNSKTLTLNEGQEATLGYSISPSNATNQNVIFSSDNELVAIVDQNGKITAKSEGIANIKVKTVDRNHFDECKVTVNKSSSGGGDTPINPTTSKSVTFTVDSKTSVSKTESSATNISGQYSQTHKDVGKMTKGNSSTLTITSLPKCHVKKITLNMHSNQNGGGGTFSYQLNNNAQQTIIVDAPFDNPSWHGSNSQAFVDVVKNVDIPINSNDTLKLLINATSHSLYINSYTIEYEVEKPSNILINTISVNPNSVTLDISQNQKLNVTILPNNATNKNLTYESGNQNVVKVSNSGVITAVGEGNTTITVKTCDGSNKSAVCEVTVNKPMPQDVKVNAINVTPSSLQLTIGQTQQLNVEVLPNDATNKEVSYSASNNVVSVSNTGFITALSEGDSLITITSKDGSNVKATCSINVVGQPVNPNPGGDNGGQTPDPDLQPNEPTELTKTTTQPLLNPSTYNQVVEGKYFMIAINNTDQSMRYLDSSLVTGGNKPAGITINSLDDLKNKDSAAFTFESAGSANAFYIKNASGYLTSDGNGTDFDTPVATPTSKETYTLSEGSKYGTTDANIIKISNVRTILYSNKYDVFGDYSSSNATSSNYSCIYLYKCEYVYDLLIKDLVSMNCAKMKEQNFNNTIKGYYNSLTQNEKTALSNHNITCSNGLVYSAEYAYQYALNEYQINTNHLENIISDDQQRLKNIYAFAFITISGTSLVVLFVIIRRKTKIQF